MVVSQRKLKEKFKNKLPPKTHVRDGVYELMSKIMEVKLNSLCDSIQHEFEQSGDKAINRYHVSLAWSNEIIKNNIEVDDNDIKYIFENE